MNLYLWKQDLLCLFYIMEKPWDVAQVAVFQFAGLLASKQYSVHTIADQSYLTFSFENFVDSCQGIQEISWIFFWIKSDNYIQFTENLKLSN